METWMFVLLVPGLIVGAVFLYVAYRILSGALRMMLGAGIGPTLKAYGWLLVGLIVLPVALYLLMTGSIQIALVILGIVVGAFAVQTLMKSPPKSWLLIGGIAAAILFLAWTPNLNMVTGWVNNYQTWASETTQRCGASEFIEQEVTSHVTATRFDARLNCRAFSIYKPVGVAFEIRYNGTGSWQTWTSGGPPRATRTIRYAEIRLAEAGASQVVEVRFPN